MFCPSLNHSQMSGNPVKIGDGYATVTGYKLPRPLVNGPGRRERGLSPKSGYRFDCARPGPACAGQLLRQEKDEASPPDCLPAGFVECLHSPSCGVWRFFILCPQRFIAPQDRGLLTPAGLSIITLRGLAVEI